jgi:hypothetical protein
MKSSPSTLRKIQVGLLSTATFLIVWILLTSFFLGGPVDDFGIEWQEPASMTLDEVSADDANETFLLTFHLWDAEQRATEWDGRMGLRLADENMFYVLEKDFRVRSDDFTTTKGDSTVDTVLHVTVPYDELSHITEAIRFAPELLLSVHATFSFGSETLVSEVWWWTPPSSVVVDRVTVDEEAQEIELGVELLDLRGRTTKSVGELRFIIWDSTGNEMYNDTIQIDATDFSFLAIGRFAYVWFLTGIPFEDIELCQDRLESDDGKGSGRTMRVFAWFTSDVTEVRQDPNGEVALDRAQRIPDALLLENQPPRPELEADRIGLVDTEKAFDASGTWDDLGTEGLVYVWSWGDGTVEEVTHTPITTHSFSRAGTFTVDLRVIDAEGASATANVSLEIFQNPRVDPEDIGSNSPGDRLRDSYLAIRVGDILAPDRW